MAKTTRQMPAFNGVAEGAKATLNMPIGLTYHGLILTRGGTAFTHDSLGEMILKANGRDIMTFSAADLDDMQAHDGLAVGGAALSYLSFERPGLLDRSWVEATAIGTGKPLSRVEKPGVFNPVPITSLTLECNISGSTAPTLSARAVQSGPSVTGGIIKRRRFTYSPAGAGDFEISDLPKGDLINRIWIKGAGDKILDVKLDRDNFRAFDRTQAENEFIQTDGVKSPVNLWFVVDPTEAGNGNEAIVTQGVDDFRLIVNVSGAETLTVYVDYIGGLNGN